MQCTSVRFQGRVALQARAVRPASVIARADKNPLEKAGDAIKEVAQDFADAQKMPKPENDELTKDGAFYTVKNDNPLVKDTDMRNGKVTEGVPKPSTPFQEKDYKEDTLPGQDAKL